MHRPPRTASRLLAPLLILGSSLHAAPLQADTEEAATVDFEAMANGFLAENGLEATGKVQDLLDGEHFLRVEIGGFDLRIPKGGLADPEAGERVEEAALALIDLQEVWFGWRATAGDAEAYEKDWNAVRKWVKTWSGQKLARCEGGEASLLEELRANNKVTEAQARLREYTRPEEKAIKTVGDLNVVVLASTRRDFIQVVAVCGLLDERSRSSLWKDEVIKQPATWTGWTQLVSLENPAWPVDLAEPFASDSHKRRDKTGLSQFVVDRGATFVLRKHFFRHGTHFFEQALGTNLVIAAIGKNNLYSGDWKLEYRTSGAKTQAYERFVPGGNPSGGTLPPRRAGPGMITGSMVEISRYRANEGVGFFVEPLKEGQKLGAKSAGKDKDNPLRHDKLAHFQLHSFEENTDFPIAAPFLGPFAEGKTLPPLEFLDDYEDFFRAYRAGFISWLQSAGAGDEEESQARFAQLLEAQATRKNRTAFHEVVESVYGVPLSGENGETDSLEWRFLAYLKKGR
jgi:hypothetical protein